MLDVEGALTRLLREEKPDKENAAPKNGDPASTAKRASDFTKSVVSRDSGQSECLMPRGSHAAEQSVAAVFLASLRGRLRTTFQSMHRGPILAVGVGHAVKRGATLTLASCRPRPCSR